MTIRKLGRIRLDLARFIYPFVWVLCVASNSPAQPVELDRIVADWDTTQDKIASGHFEFHVRQIAKADAPAPHSDIRGPDEQNTLRFRCKFLFKGTKMRFEKEGPFWNDAQKNYVREKRVYTWNDETSVELFYVGDPHYPYAFVNDYNSLIEQTISPLRCVLKVRAQYSRGYSVMDSLIGFKQGDWTLMAAEPSSRIHRLVHRSGRGKRTSICTVNEDLGNSIIRFESKHPRDSFEFSVGYRFDLEQRVWVPFRWSSDGARYPYAQETAFVTKYSLNIDIDDSQFNNSLPPDTIVTDHRYKGTPKENYMLRANGKLQIIAGEDLSKTREELIKKE